ncbi:MAG: hypothetical protein HKN13_07865, partial [Rhodothermales bacterium]|nr:hypothetical protein [Rhodothermales bacterium]
ARSVGSRETAAADSTGDYEDFLERYVNYRIKVLEAKRGGLESDSAIVAELAGYRSQYAKPYLINQKVLDPIINDYYARSLEMVEASHILLRTAGNQSPADTLALYSKLSTIRDSALAGVDFGQLAVRHSEDPSAAQVGSPLGYEGYLGFFTSGAMVPSFEDQAYATPVGDISPVFRTRFGYHILRVSDRKPTPDDRSISHIMITPKGQTAADAAMTEVLVDSLYQKTLRGEDFATLAEAFSDDKQSGTNGGSLGVIGYGSRLLPIMKDAAFKIQEEGGIAAPVMSRFGYHIIRLDKIHEPKTLADSYEELKTKASRSAEATLGQRALADSVLAAAGAEVDSVRFFSAFDGLMPDSIATLVLANAVPQADSILATLHGKSYTVADAANSVSWSRLRAVRDQSPRDVQRIALRDYMRDLAIDHEVDELEQRDDNFRTTMNEFRNGILLFRLMEDSVWTAAAQDTVALKSEYDRDPSRFTYPDRTRLVTYYSTSKEVIDAVHESLANQTIGSMPDSMMSAVRVDTTFLAGPSNSIYDRGLEQPVGSHTDALAYNSGSIVIVNDGVEAARGKTFDESRAELINIIQEELEARLVARLRSDYRVATYPDNLIGVFSDTLLGDESQ